MPGAEEHAGRDRRGKGVEGGQQPEVVPFRLFLMLSVISLACFAALSTWYFSFSSFSLSSVFMISSTFIGWNFLRKCGLIAYVFGFPALSLSAIPAAFLFSLNSNFFSLYPLRLQTVVEKQFSGVDNRTRGLSFVPCGGPRALRARRCVDGRLNLQPQRPRER